MNKRTRLSPRLSALTLSLGLGIASGIQANTYALGDNSIADGNSAIATGRNSIAIGSHTVATGDNLTAAEITQKLADNATQLQNIRNKKHAVQTATADFNAKYTTYLEVKGALEKIAEGETTLNEELKPALTKAERDLTEYTPVFETKKQEVTARTENLITLSGFDLTKATTTAGITELAQALKQAAEQGYETLVNEPVSYYEQYVKNYIQANGHVATAISSYTKLIGANLGTTTGYYHTSPLQTQGYITRRALGGELNALPIISGDNITESRTYSFKSGNVMNFYYPDQTASLSKSDLDEWLHYADEQKTSIYNTLLATKNIYFDSDGAKETTQTLLNQQFDYFTALVKSRYYQGQYNELGANTTEGLAALQNKLRQEQEMARLKVALKEKNVTSEMKTFFDAWRKENITDIQQKNSQFIKEFRANLIKIMADEQKKYDALVSAKQVAQQAITHLEAQLARLEPGEQKRRIAAQAEAAKALLAKQEAELKALEAALSLNDLRNIGQDAIAIGSETRVTGERALGIGYQNTVTGSNSLAIGNQNSVAGQYDIVIGHQNQTPADSENNVVIGRQITLADNGKNSVKQSVVLGYQSTLSAPVATASHTINNQLYSFAGATPFGTFSIGSAGKERTLTHLAAGRLSRTSTDAVNGSQLFALVEESNRLGTTLTGVEKTATENKTALANHTRQIAENTTSIESNKQSIAANKTTIDKQQQQLTSQDKQLEQHSHVLSGLNNTVTQQTADINANKQAIHEHKTQLVQHSSVLEKQQQTLTAHANRLDRQDQNLTTLTTLTHEHTTTIDENKQKIADNAVVLTRHSTALAQQQQTLTAQGSKIENVEKDIATANLTLLQQESQISDNVKGITKNREDIAALQQGLGTVNGHITNHNTQLTELNNRVNTQHDRLAHHDRELAAHTSTLADHGTQLTTHSETLKTHAERLIQHTGDLTTLKSTQQTQGETLITHGNRLETHGNQLNTHSGTLVQHGDDINRLKNATNSNTALLTSHTTRLDGLDRRVEKQDLQLVSHSTQLADYSVQLANHTSTLNTHTETLQQQQQTVSTLQQTQQNHTQTLQQQGEHLAQHDQNINTISNQVKGLEANTAKTVFFDSDKKRSITLGKENSDGSRGTTVIKQVGEGEIKAGSKEAINGGQLYHSQETLITQLRQEMLQLKPNINTAQIVRDSVTEANVYTDHRVHQLQQHTEQRIAQVNRDIRQVRKEARAGISAAMAISAIERVPGKKATIGAGIGSYGSETAVAIGLKALPHKQVMVTLAGSVDSQKNVGGSAGISIGF
ncbi:YadA-like family protein [Pasteurella testudinis]|uniref:YadA-like family protein n=1 Tax=Pasteurella testudinis TaxID=761 RepID=UPI004058369C